MLVIKYGKSKKQWDFAHHCSSSRRTVGGSGAWVTRRQTKVHKAHEEFLQQENKSSAQHWPLTCSWVEWVRFPSELDTWHLYTPEMFLEMEASDSVPLSTWHCEVETSVQRDVTLNLYHWTSGLFLVCTFIFSCFSTGLSSLCHTTVGRGFPWAPQLRVSDSPSRTSTNVGGVLIKTGGAETKSRKQLNWDVLDVQTYEVIQKEV